MPFVMMRVPGSWVVCGLLGWSLVSGCQADDVGDGVAELGGESETGGDGDGDGDGDTGDGDGDGDGDGNTGDGDGDGETGDGDGDADTGDGDGDGDTGDGDGDLCPGTLGVGGAVGQSPITAPSYPNTPGVIHVPASYDPGQPMPLMLALHGSGDTAGNFVNLWSGIADAEGFIVLVPESLSGGASWNPGTDTQLISDLLDEAAAAWNVDDCRIYLTGYSAGAHYGYMLGLANSTYFAALGIQAGSLSYAEQGGVWPDLVERTIAVDIHHGVNDPGVPLSQAEHARDELEAAGHTVYFHTHNGGHEIGAGNPEEMWGNIAGHTVND